MSQIVDCSEFCRLCLVKEQVNTPIFEEDGGYHQLSTKISTCLPVKVSREDSLPKRICDGCCYKVEQQYQFWNISLNAEKQFKQWLGISEDTETAKQNVNKIKKESTYDGPSASKRPKRNARRKAVQNIRQATAAQQSDSDSDIPLAARTVAPSIEVEPIAKDENDSDHHDFPEDNDSMDPPNFVNMNLEGEQDQAGPSGLQKAESTEPVEAAPATLNMEIEAGEGDLTWKIKQEPLYEEQQVAATSDVDKEIQGYTIRKNMICCKLCDKTFRKFTRWKIHSREHEPDEELNYHIQDVKVEIKDDPTLGHSILFQALNKNLNNALNETDNYFRADNKICCKLCTRTFKKPAKWRVHYRGVHCNIRLYNCDQCSKRFKEKSQLKVHRMTHETDRPKFACNICSKEFHYASSARVCEKNHSQLFKMKCPHCDKGFHYQSLLDTHIEVKHNAVRQECPICNKTFANKVCLAAHGRIHEPDYVTMQYSCERCGKTYNSRKCYQRHMKSHEGFACDICGRIFGYEHGLKSHMLIHKGERPWNCEVCGKSFNKKHIMTVHLRTHTNEKPYKCDVCGKRFTQRSPLVIHMRSHTGERPYPCKLCDNSFVSKNYLRIHMQNLHDCPNI